MMTNGGRIFRGEVMASMIPLMRKEGGEKFDSSMINLERLKIVVRSGFENPCYTVNHYFQEKFN